ncbi:MAG: hypothetical protein CMC08_02790 [Flavobacteriaceae bacterium]|nr:hypothetical protein [Flavobacteriaceae bacterium]
MLLVYTQKITPRVTYIFKHVCTRILGVEVGFTSVIEELIAYTGAKISYGKQPMGNELFIQSQGLLTQQGIESIDITVRPWDDTVGFFPVSEKSALPFDIFSAGFYLLSRYEEYLPHVKDEMGRYPAAESLGYREQFLESPVIDIWAYKLRHILREAFPDTLQFPEKKMTVHNVIAAKQPFAYNQKGLFRSVVGYLGDLLQLRFREIGIRTQVLLRMRRDPYDTFRWIVKVGKKSASQVSVFFLLGESPTFDESINTHRHKFKLLIKFIGDYKEVGLLFSSRALIDYRLLKKEKLQMEEIVNRSLQNSMNTDYLVDLPDIYRNLVELEVRRDFTLVYETTPGFRAGTCTPFLFYDLDYEIKTPLQIHPVALTADSLLTLPESKVHQQVDALMEQVRQVNGTFTMVFSNVHFSFDQEQNKLWRKIYSEKLQIHEAS